MVLSEYFRARRSSRTSDRSRQAPQIVFASARELSLILPLQSITNSDISNRIIVFRSQEEAVPNNGTAFFYEYTNTLENKNSWPWLSCHPIISSQQLNSSLIYTTEYTLYFSLNYPFSPKFSFSLFPEIRYNLHYLFFCVLFICMLIYSYYCIFIMGLVNA